MGRVGWSALGVSFVTGCFGQAADRTEPDLAVQTSALSSGPPTITLTVAVPPGRTADEIGLGATRSLTLGDRSMAGRAAPGPDQTLDALITNTGTGTTRIGNDAHVGDILSKGPVTLGDRAGVEGFVRSGGSIGLGNGAYVVGSKLANATFAAPLTRSWSVTLPTQIRPDVALEPDQQGSAAPGRYRKLVVKSRATLTLSAGTYFVETLQLEPQGTLKLDQSAGPVRLYVTSTLIYRGNVIAADGADPRLFVGYTSSNALALEAPFKGTLVAPNASVRLATLPVPHKGRFFGRDIVTDAATVLELTPRADCGDPLIPDGSTCTDGNACTANDRCQSGVCSGTPLEAPCAGDSCHEDGVCNPTTGACERAPRPNGTVCVDEEFNEGSCQDARCLTTATGCTFSTAFQRWQTQEGGWQSTQEWLSGDFDGDGYSDMALAFRDGSDISIDVHRNQWTPERGSHFGLERWATRQGGWPNPYRWLSGDFDNDGRSDLALAFEDGDDISIDVHRSTGSDAFELQRWQTRQGGWPARNSVLAGDFTGDGWVDIAVAFDNGGSIATDIHPNVGGRFDGFVRWPTDISVGWPAGWTWLTGDFDGSGTLDLALVFPEDGYISIDVHLNRGGYFEVKRWQTRGGGWNGGVGSFLSGDFDGDEDVDIAFAFADKGEVSIDLYANEGNIFKHERFASYQGSWPAASGWVTGYFDDGDRIDLAKAFTDDGDISVDVYLTGDFLRACLPTGIAFQGFPIEDSFLDDLESNETQGIASSSEYWYWSTDLEAANVPVSGGSMIDPVERTQELKHTFFRNVSGPCDDERGYDHFGDLDVHGGFAYLPMQGNCVPDAVLVMSAELDHMYGWGTLGKGGGAWVSIHPKDGWLYTSGSAPSAPIPPGVGQAFTVIRAYDVRLENLKPIPTNQQQIDDLLEGCLGKGQCAPTDLGYIGHLQLVPNGTPTSGSWDDYWIQGGDISPNGVLYYAFDHADANHSHRTGAHVFDLRPFGADAVPSALGITGENAYEVYVDGDESRGFLNADYDAYHWPRFLKRADELEGIDVYKGTDGLTHVLMIMLSNYGFLDDVSLYHWTTNEP